MEDKKTRKKKTHCKYGHLYDDTNTYFDIKRGIRQCKKCKSNWFLKEKKTNPIKQKERQNKNAKRWRDKNPEKVYENCKKYALKNPEKRRILYEKGKLKQHGITLEKYNEMLSSQFGVCAICNKPETIKHQSGRIKTLAIDHIHNTKIIRGLLCQKCNQAIGLFNDDSTLLLSAIKYLNKSNE